MTFAVSDMPINVLPWNAWSNATTAERPVAFRAILTAFSTASAPELANIVLTGPSIGISVFSRSASSMYGSFAVTWKQVCVFNSGSRWLGVTDHMDHAEPGLALEPVGEVEAEPARRARRQGGEHDRFERFPAEEHVLHGEGGVGVAHLAVHVGVESREPCERLLQPGFRDRPCLGLGPGVVPRWLGRDDDVERTGTVPGELGALVGR